ncbi:MAG: Hsp20/alpha crystallin family protein [Desulfobacterales bacterium]|nr:Hsp20/alpha crystallin family protein [Desulfobacterales bacterium]
MTAAQELQVKEKQEVASPAEQTKPGIIFTPDVDIFETDRNITLLADMPGVAADDIEIDLRENILTVAGDVKPFEGADESDILVEFEIGKYHRQFTLSDKIDQGKIEANFEDGVLRLTLPKEEKAAPRKIAVKSA